MSEYRGTLNIVSENNKEWYEIKSEFEIELMIERIIPSHQKFPLKVRVHPENTQMLRMIMKEYPLEILTDKWEKAQEEILNVDRLKTKLAKLDYVEPSKANFTGELYPFQKEGLDFIIKTQGKTLITDEMGLGKAQPLYSKILTPRGWNLMKNIRVNDYVIGVKGKPVKVIGVYPQGKQKIFEVFFNDGSKTRCSEEHLWAVKDANQRFRNSSWRILELKTFRNDLFTKYHNSKHFIPIVEPIEFNKKYLIIEPYLLGVILGDGGIKNSAIISTMDLDLLENIEKSLPVGISIRKQKGKNCDYQLTSGFGSRNNILINQLRYLKLMGKGSDDKFIPSDYLEGSVEQRTALLQGLLDTDGYAAKDGTIQYSSNSEFLIKGMIDLVRSLGGIAKLTTKTSASKKLHHTITITLPNIIIPFRIQRKLARFKPRVKYKPYRCITKIECIGIEDAQCIKVNSEDGLYITDDYIVTHNTVETLAYLATQPDAFPAVIVAPLVTLTNWKREIEKFLRLDHSVNTQQKLDGIEKSIPVVEIIREGKLSTLKPADFYVINYDLMTKRFPNLAEINPRTAVFDECHALRNSSTKRYEACNAMAYLPSVRYRLGLSGTPLYNRGFEMFSIIEVLKAGLLGDAGEFYRRYCDRWNSGMTKEEAKSGLSEFLKKSIMLRRKKAEVLPDLPDKIKMKQTIDIDREKYHSELKKLYKEIDLIRAQMLSGSLTEDSKKEGLFAVNKKIREMTLAERQIAGIAKAPFVVKYLLEMFEDYEDEKFVVFCHHLTVHKILLDGLWKFNPVQVIGGQSDKERQAAIDSFQNDKKTRVIICGLRAGSLGINLTSAAYVIFAELDWSPSIHAQAEDRLHRIGQKQKVFAHYLEGAGTFDEILSQILMRKTLVISDVMGEKMEKLNNKQALQYLEDKFKISESTKLSKILQD